MQLSVSLCFSLPTKMERLQWILRPPMCIAGDSDTFEIIVQLSDDMGRSIMPTADLHLLCRWDGVDNAEAVGISMMCYCLLRFAWPTMCVFK